jgi:hypothetical protein
MLGTSQSLCVWLRAHSLVGSAAYHSVLCTHAGYFAVPLCLAARTLFGRQRGLPFCVVHPCWVLRSPSVFGCTAAPSTLPPHISAHLCFSLCQQQGNTRRQCSVQLLKGNGFAKLWVAKWVASVDVDGYGGGAKRRRRQPNETSLSNPHVISFPLTP